MVACLLLVVADLIDCLRLWCVAMGLVVVSLLVDWLLDGCDYVYCL